METVRGYVDHIVFQNKENGYAVISFVCEGEELICVGSFQSVEAVRTFTMKPKGNGIGIKNISERLKLFFSGEAVMEIWSQPGEGTRIHIEIPKKERDIHVQDDCDRR